jgi:hypothetical protein
MRNIIFYIGFMQENVLNKLKNIFTKSENIIF